MFQGLCYLMDNVFDQTYGDTSIVVSFLLSRSFVALSISDSVTGDVLRLKELGLNVIFEVGEMSVGLRSETMLRAALAKKLLK